MAHASVGMRFFGLLCVGVLSKSVFEDEIKRICESPSIAYSKPTVLSTHAAYKATNSDAGLVEWSKFMSFVVLASHVLDHGLVHKSDFVAEIEFATITAQIGPL